MGPAMGSPGQPPAQNPKPSSHCDGRADGAVRLREEQSAVLLFRVATRPASPARGTRLDYRSKAIADRGPFVAEREI